MHLTTTILLQITNSLMLFFVYKITLLRFWWQKKGSFIGSLVEVSCQQMNKSVVATGQDNKPKTNMLNVLLALRANITDINQYPAQYQLRKWLSSVKTCLSKQFILDVSRSECLLLLALFYCILQRTLFLFVNVATNVLRIILVTNLCLNI